VRRERNYYVELNFISFAASTLLENWAKKYFAKSKIAVSGFTTSFKSN